MFILFILVLIGAGVLIIVSYNALQVLAQEVYEKNSNVQIAISKKLSLINQLIDVVKSYQEGEQLVHLKISQDNTASNLMSSYHQSGSVLASMQSMAERFPNLKANEQYHQLVVSIQKCEHDIQLSRENYNHWVKIYNTKRLHIPTIFVARLMNFSPAPYLEFDLSGTNDVTNLKEFKTDDGERLQQLFSKAGNQIAGATLTLATHASQAGKLIAGKIKDKPADMYFYMVPGGVPKGPHPPGLILDLLNQGLLTEVVLVSAAGAEEWKNITTLKDAYEIRENVT